jgi:trehalose 6-phosphate phosphatase
VSDLLSKDGRAALARLRECPHDSAAIFGFDFDGTLAPIRPTPGEVAMGARSAAAFAALTRRVPVAVITGRGVADVRSRLSGTPRWAPPGAASWRAWMCCRLRASSWKTSA